MTPQYILRASMCREPFCGMHDKEEDQHYAEMSIENLGYAHEYAEPGYGDPAKGILFSNWNHFPSKATDLLEQYGYACEWEDEWSTCSDCGRAVRTSPDSYSWEPYYIEGDGELLCLDCVDWPEYLETIEDDPRKACFSHCDPAEYGYQRISEPNEYESGLRLGQTDDPVKILAMLKEQGHKRILFRISDTGQFDISFEAWEWNPGCLTGWDRFDICEAWYLYAMNYHDGGGSAVYALFSVFSRLHFTPRPMLSSWVDLSENGRSIYARLVRGESKVRDRR